MPLMDRRRFLRDSASAFAAGGIGLYHRLALAARSNGGRPLSPLPGHHPARAKSLIFVSLTGGFSHVDTFDFKPKLKADHKKTVSAPSLRDVTTLPLLGSHFEFTPRA